MKKIMQIIISIIALTVLAPGHAKEVGKQSDLECLARNIYFEAASESIEGKVAVGLVTINRSKSGRFPSTICGVVSQRTVISVPRQVTQIRTVTEGKIFKKTYEVKEVITVWTSHAVCQFSWNCEPRRTVKQDWRWAESLAVAKDLLSGGHEDFRIKYYDAMYFHERRIRPKWAHQKRLVEKVGGHIFYADVS
jgi:spore germination cell wall hydrolase CwlJ-like protein